MLNLLHYYFAPVNAPWWQGAIYGNIFAAPILAIGFYVALFRKFTCSQPHCIRFSHHQVKATKYHTCSKHATKEIHAKLTEKHKAKYPEQHQFLKSLR